MEKISKHLRIVAILASVLCLILLPGCSEEPMAPESLDSANRDAQFKSGKSIESVINLEGFTRFHWISQQTKEVISDGQMNYLVCTAELEFTDKHHFVMSTHESFPGPGGMLYREATFTGKISSSGVIQYLWPETWTEFGMEASNVVGQIMLHLNLKKLQGAGIVQNTTRYNGVFDGISLESHMIAIGFQNDPEPGTPPGAIVEGPIQIDFSLELMVVD